LNKPLNKDDAKIVHVIHTDSTFFGASEKSGTVDFWPNGGKNQPGCPRPNLDYNSEESKMIWAGVLGYIQSSTEDGSSP